MREGKRKHMGREKVSRRETERQVGKREMERQRAHEWESDVCSQTGAHRDTYVPAQTQAGGPPHRGVHPGTCTHGSTWRVRMENNPI